MRICILGSKKSEETKLLITEAKKRGHTAQVVLVDNLIFAGGKEKIITFKGKDLAQLFETVIVRGLNRHPDEILLLCAYLAEKKVVVVDKRLVDKRYYRTKLATAFKFAGSGINYPQTYFISGLKNLKTVFKKVGFPLIAKESWGMHSRGVLRFKNEAEAEQFFKNRQADYLIQEDLKESNYYRLLIVGHEVLGIIKRTKIRTLSCREAKSGVKSTKVELSGELKKLALRIAKISGNDICGIDLINHKGKYYSIEANRSPQFRAFSEVTGINVAEKIIKYLEDRIKRNERPRAKN